LRGVCDCNVKVCVDINCRVVNNNAGGLIETKREKGKEKKKFEG
jgi:hypothetical protein